ncbi:MAG: SDR family NAD(P)-dependent oxidoreductase [Dermatophilaceae bacterium]
MTIDGRVVILTGASSGIGLATARHLAGLGARLVLTARDAGTLDALTHELPGSIAVPGDVTDPQHAERLVTETLDRHGRVDVLVNNAGRAMAKPVEHIDLGEYAGLIELNVVAPLRLMQLVIPPMRAQGGGHIVNISSQASTKYLPFIAGYASTKFALNNLSLTAREELAKDGIVVSLVKPGIVDTAFGQHTPSPEPSVLRHDPAGNLLPHVISPSAVAAAVAEVIGSGAAELDLVQP